MLASTRPSTTIGMAPRSAGVDMQQHNHHHRMQQCSSVGKQYTGAAGKDTDAQPIQQSSTDITSRSLSCQQIGTVYLLVNPFLLAIYSLLPCTGQCSLVARPKWCRDPQRACMVAMTCNMQACTPPSTKITRVQGQGSEQ